MAKKRLGDVLRERGHISPQELDRVIQQQQAKALLLGELLLERGLVSREEIAGALEEVTRIKYLDCQSVTVDPEALALIPYEVAIRACALPLAREGNKLVVVLAEPQNLYTLDELRFTAGLEISPRLGFRSDIRAAIGRHYAEGAPQTEDEVIEERLLEIDDALLSDVEFMCSSTRENNREAMREFRAGLSRQRTPAIRLVSAIIAAAAAKKASDIHIDPQAKNTVVRIRVDGMLRDLMEIPQAMQASLISRVKILADMDIAERRVPQDGRFLVRLGTNKLDLRVATLPTHYGEKVVVRLLDPGSTRTGFSELGLSNDQQGALSYILTRPQGMLLVTGPTGSGKTTTLYSALNALRSRTLNIITVEDPVEYMLEGINQVQVNPKAGLTFAGCLASILRQDPNVIMVGEIRDTETAEIALTAAQTGHLVLSTVHTNDSVAAITRLLDLNAPPFLIASSVTAVIAQRLVRRLCSCRAEREMTPEYAARLLSAGIVDFPDKIYVPGGCSACDYIGYKGRLGIFELLVFNDAIRTAVNSAASQDHLRALARGSGMRLMQEEALDQAKAGATGLEEVFRVIPFEKIPASCWKCKRELAAGFLFCPYCGADRREAAAERHRGTAPVTTIRGGLRG